MSVCESGSSQAMCQVFAALPTSRDKPGDDQAGGASRPVLAESLRAPQLESLAQPGDATGGSVLSKIGIVWVKWVRCDAD